VVSATQGHDAVRLVAPAAGGEVATSLDVDDSTLQMTVGNAPLPPGYPAVASLELVMADLVDECEAQRCDNRGLQR
jgi:hypothetical protein